MNLREDLGLEFNRHLQHDNDVRVNTIEMDGNNVERESDNEPDSDNKCELSAKCEQITWTRDGVFSWLICAGCFLVNAVIYGTVGTISMLFPPLVQLYGSIAESTLVTTSAAAVALNNTNDKNELVTSQVALIAGLNYACLYLFCLAVPPLVERLGCRLLFLAGLLLSLAGCLAPGVWPHSSLWVWWLGYGVSFGIGAAVLTIVPTVVLEQSFRRHFGLATAIQWIGSTVGWVSVSLVLQLVFNYCNRHFVGAEALKLSLRFAMLTPAFLLCLLLFLYPLFASPFNLAARRRLRKQLLLAESSPSPNRNGSRKCKWRRVKLLLPKSWRRFVVPDFPVEGLRYGASAPEPEHNGVESNMAATSYKNKSNKESDTSNRKNKSMWRRWRELRTLFNRNMLIFVLVLIAFQLGSGVPDNHWILLAERQFPEHKQFLASCILVSNGVAQAPSRLFVGWLVDVFQSLSGRATLYGAGILVKGFATSFAPPALWLAPHFATVIALNLAYGAADGVQCLADTALLQRIVGSGERFGRALAITMAASGVGVLVSPSLGGLAFDLLGDYRVAFALAGIVLSASSILLFLIRPAGRKANTNRLASQQTTTTSLMA